MVLVLGRLWLWARRSTKKTKIRDKLKRYQWRWLNWRAESQKWNWATLLFPKQIYIILSPKFTFMYLWAIYLFPESVAYFAATRVSMEFHRHGIPSVFFTSVYSVFRAELAAIPAEFRRIPWHIIQWNSAEFHGIPWLLSCMEFRISPKRHI